MSENVRDLLAACWLDRDDIGDGQPFNDAWARDIIKGFRDNAHFGDCTNAANACIRCAIDEAFRGADTMLAALDAAGLVIVPKTPTMIRKIAFEYEVWTALVAMGHRGTWPRDRFESHLAAIVEEIGEDEKVIMQEAHAEAVRIGKGMSDA